MNVLPEIKTSTANLQTGPFKRIVDKIQTLPTLPTVVMELLSVARNPNASADDMEASLKHDPSLSMKVMRMANSSFYGFGNIKTIQEAIVVLGFPVIRSIILAASVFEAFPGAGRPGFSRTEFWKHSIAVATSAKLIGKRIQSRNVEECFVAGLIHDIGKIVLDEYSSDIWERVVRRAAEKNCLIIEAEMEILNFSHAQIGQWLAQKWKLPTEHTNAIFYHHQPAFAKPEENLPSIVHIADHLARKLNLGNGGDSQVPPIDPEARKRVPLNDDALASLEASIPELFEKANSSFGMTGKK